MSADDFSRGNSHRCSQEEQLRKQLKKLNQKIIQEKIEYTKKYPDFMKFSSEAIYLRKKLELHMEKYRQIELELKRGRINDR